MMWEPGIIHPSLKLLEISGDKVAEKRGCPQGYIGVQKVSDHSV